MSATTSTHLTAIGTPPWTRDDMRAKLETFATLYANRPITNNAGGMSSSHLFLLWYAMQALKPKVIIECGVWRGQGTWAIEQACPDAELYCIDINWKNLVYRSTKATYLSKDFEKHDWSHVPKEETVIFFDDHIDAVARTQAVQKLGFRHILFEDNYPPQDGSDVYSLKMAFMHAGLKASQHWRAIAGRLIGTRSDRTITPNASDDAKLRQVIDVYEEMPPVFTLPVTRWGDAWDNENYPTPEPLLASVTEPWQQVYYDEAQWYTWLCYVRLARR
ncbi:MAG: uncharacterized protein JWL61_5014 [Gemmatimonadetes bacterium]|nr:uncharacterized protein [Gemmatimonadota bacterium]